MKINQQKVLANIKKAKMGDQMSFKYLLDTFWSYVFNFQLKKIENENDAEDITIRTFSKATKKPGLSPVSFCHFVKAIIRRFRLLRRIAVFQLPPSQVRQNHVRCLRR